MSECLCLNRLKILVVDIVITALAGNRVDLCLNTLAKQTLVGKNHIEKSLELLSVNTALCDGVSNTIIHIRGYEKSGVICSDIRCGNSPIGEALHHILCVINKSQNV